MGRRETKKEATKRKILDVSLQLFTREGFGKTTMRDIARRAGIALGTTYNYFPTKEHIALYFFETALEEVMARYRREAPADAPLEEKLFLLLSIELEQLAPYEAFLHLVIATAVVPGSRLHPFSVDSQRLKSKYLEFAGRIFEEAQARGELKTFGFDAMLLSAFWIFKMGLILFWLGDASPKKEDTFVLLDKSLRFVLEGLRGGKPKGRRR
ncbi:MAG TPA: TetR/AcrR family transcriptional regulator [Planctomycetota bacterium]|nr:TetR/AcrR family transcriptional regulator [Planctomycetota bacterium]